MCGLWGFSVSSFNVLGLGLTGLGEVVCGPRLTSGVLSKRSTSAKVTPPVFLGFYVVVSLNKGDPNIDPQKTIVLILGHPKKGTSNFGKDPCRLQA